jgi:putative spermidine/putrescine transport system permease protein
MADLSASGAAKLTTADGRPLKAALATAQGRARRRAFFLVLPLLAFVLLTFILPIGQMLKRSVLHDGFSSAAPALTAWFEANPSETVPDEAAYAALATDLKRMKTDKSAGNAGTRINYNVSGSRPTKPGCWRWIPRGKTR